MKLELDRDEIDTAVDLLRGVFGASTELRSSLASITERVHSLEVSRNQTDEDMHYTRATLENIIDSITAIRVMVNSHERCIATINKHVDSMLA